MEKNTKTATPREVAETVKRHLRRNGTLKDAQLKLGVTPQSISTQLNGKTYLSQKNARRYSMAYGFAIPYLVSGTGEPFEDEEGVQRYPVSYSLDLTEEDAEACDVTAMGTQKSERVNEAIYKAFGLICSKMNTLRNEYLSYYDTLSYMRETLSPGSEEMKAAEETLKNLQQLNIPKL